MHEPGESAVPDGASEGQARVLSKPASSRMPAGSHIYTRVLPVLILVLALVMVGLILVAAGVVWGIVPFR